MNKAALRKDISLVTGDPDLKRLPRSLTSIGVGVNILGSTR